MTEICYLNLKQAREVLAGIGVELSPRQINRAADKAHRMAPMRRIRTFTPRLERGRASNFCR